VFDKLTEIIASTWLSLIPWVVVPVYMNAGVLRFGKYNRTLVPGFHWRIPFVEESNHHHVVMTTLRLPPQTCTTKDRKSVVLSAVIKFRLEDVKAFMCGCVSQQDVLTDVTMGAILTAVRAFTFDGLVDDPPESKVAAIVRRQVKPLGFDIMAVTFTDLGAVRSVRLIQDHNSQEVIE